MEEMHYPIQDEPMKEPAVFHTGKRELIFGACILLSSLFLVNCALFYGLNLGFSIAACLSILFSSVYLLGKGAKHSPYSITLLVLSLVIAASFARSDDAFVKFVMFCFLLVSVNLGLCLLSGKNRRKPGIAFSLLDAGYTLFNLGFGKMPESYRGLHNAFKRSGSVGQKSSAVILGLCIAIPILLIIVPLLMFADAAFEGLLDKLPEFDAGELFTTVLFGICAAFIFYTRGTALRHSEAPASAHRKAKGLSPLTVNTVLISVCLVYCVYLVSQLAYFSGGFSGILPEEYTMAQYARRGFFEMAWLCAINLCVMVGSLGLCAKEKTAPLSTRLLCLFIGIVTLFLVSTASAKMLMYIGSYGLTRLRVLTQVVMVFFAIVTLLVSVWLFVPRLRYMKAIVISAMVICAAVSWTDVDSQVAKYNVDAYLNGKMDTVDVSHLSTLNDSAVPHLKRLSKEADDPLVVEMAQDILTRRGNRFTPPEDFRQWNYGKHVAQKYLPEKDAQVTVPAEDALELFGVLFPNPNYLIAEDTHGGFHGDGLLYQAAALSEPDHEKAYSQLLDASQWIAFPLSDDLQTLLYDHSLLEMEGYDVPIVENGFYCFYDRHSETVDPSDPSNLFNRASFNFTLAIYDTDARTVYLWDLDT